jgi:hypothetical protein
VQWGPKMQNVYNNSKEKIEQKKKEERKPVSDWGGFSFRNSTTVLELQYSNNTVKSYCLFFCTMAVVCAATQRNGGGGDKR